jgi:hypothetical protein
MEERARSARLVVVSNNGRESSTLLFLALLETQCTVHTMWTVGARSARVARRHQLRCLSTCSLRSRSSFRLSLTLSLRVEWLTVLLQTLPQQFQHWPAVGGSNQHHGFRPEGRLKRARSIVSMTAIQSARGHARCRSSRQHDCCHTWYGGTMATPHMARLVEPTSRMVTGPVAYIRALRWYSRAL